MGLELVQSQELVLSQRMILSASILQMNTQELEEYLVQAAVENPVIEIDEIAKTNEEKKEKLWDYELSVARDNVARVYYHEDYRAGDNDDEHEYELHDNLGDTLAEYLKSQLMAVSLTPAVHRAAVYIIEALNPNGYLEDSDEDVARGAGVTLEEEQEALKVVRSFEPAGVAYRKLRECLLAQIERRGIEDPVLTAIVDRHLEDLAKNKLPYIAKKLGITVNEVKAAAEAVRGLNPKPATGFSRRENLKYIVPEIFVSKFEDHFEILTDEYTLPSINISNYYREVLQSTDDKEARSYVDQKIRQAEWLRTCVSHRSSTILNVSRCIVERQKPFFTNGPGHLRPMKLEDIAADIGVHESTVSRATKDKFLQCSWGVYPLNYFFRGAIPSKRGGAVTTSEKAKIEIRKLIENEDHNAPLSDRLIVEKLEQAGISISRRTVAKYRESMGIGDASKRRQY
ncbi:MAG: RNA polymerase factor sigma-54 [Lachnospiraceae bacterium]|nr:RNA polymerase factor sigma-54 [Lachnospiraceae bacterium]